jgi:hypothetical protein
MARVPDATWGLTRRELRALRSLRTPALVQRALDHDIGYNHSDLTCRSPRRVLRDRTAHCLEGALFAAAALRLQGREPLLLDLEAVRDDDHVLAVFRERGHWGAIGKSNFSGLRFRAPVYRTLRELVMSYFEHYYNLARERTLRRYSRSPLPLRRFDRLPWMTTEEELFSIGDALGAMPHVDVLRAPQIASLTRVDRRLFQAGLVGRVLP